MKKTSYTNSTVKAEAIFLELTHYVENDRTTDGTKQWKQLFGLLYYPLMYTALLH